MSGNYEPNLLDDKVQAEQAKQTMNTTPYLNKAAVKKLALAVSRNTGRPFTRVSKEFLEGINALVAESVGLRVHRAPSKGKTL